MLSTMPIPSLSCPKDLLTKLGTPTGVFKLFESEFILVLSRLIASEATAGRNQDFLDSLAADKDLGATRGIDAALKAYDLDALVLPAIGKSTTPAGKCIYKYFYRNPQLNISAPSDRRLPYDNR